MVIFAKKLSLSFVTLSSLIISLGIFLVLIGCSTDDISDDNKGNLPPETLSPAGIDELLTAYEKDKIISNILFIPSSEELGARWLISFTDSSSINVFNEGNEITPYIRVENEGFWSVSYNGTTFEAIRDNEGFIIEALSKEIDPDNQEQTEMDLLCVAPSFNPYRNYVFDIYYSSKPGYIIDSVSSGKSYVSDKSLFGIVQNDYNGIISFYIKDKGVINFPYNNRWPYSFGIVSGQVPIFNYPAEEIELEFFVTPSDVDFHLEDSSTGLKLEIVYVKGEEAKNFVSYPVVIKDISKVSDNGGKGNQGRYKAILMDAGDNLFTYNEDVFLSLKYLGVDRQTLSISTDTFPVKYNSDSPMIIDSEIPVVKILSPKSITSKDIWTDDCEIEILNAGKYDKKYSKVQIKGRGNSTWVLPKKPYAIKLDKKDEVLGFPKHKRWVLLANYYDKSNLRNEIAFYMGRLSAIQTEPGLQYTPRSAFARLFFNEKFQGLYQLTEQLKIDDKRVDVGDDGYLLEIDFRATEDPENIYFKIPHIPQYIVIKDPDIESQSQLDFIKEFMMKADSALFGDNFLDPKDGYKKYIDIYSFIDWYLINEITKNADANYYTSCYMNLSRNGKLKMGPLWDFDLAAGNYIDFGDWWYTQWINKTEDFHIKNVEWYDRLFQDPEFIMLLKQRFQYFYDHQGDIMNELDRQRELISEIIEENERVWFFFSKPFNKETTLKGYNATCEELKTWLLKRFSWLKVQYDNL